MDHIDVGINTYRVLIHRHKDQNADLLISDLKGKDPDTILRADLAALMFTPLMSGLTTQKERVLESAKLLQQEYPAVSSEDRKKMLAVLYVLATKFLTVEEMNEVKEVFSMNPLGKMIFDDGMQSGWINCRTDSILDLLRDLGSVTADLGQKIKEETDDDVLLRRWLKLAAHSESIEAFVADM